MGNSSNLDSVKLFTDSISNQNKQNKHRLIWDDILLENGYYCVSIPNVQHWTAIHAWLEKNIDPKEYVWVGLNFYFTYHRDAVLFALKWA